MSVSPEPARRQLQLNTALYSLLWLLAANLVGLWLAVLLVWPECGRWMGEFTYGRWMPLHMDWQLYGWCSLPLVGLLIRYFQSDVTSEDVHFGFLVWSIALGLGGLTSLHGVVSGKLFLNWAGLARVAFPVAQLLLWAILAQASFMRWRRRARIDVKQCLQGFLLGLLLLSPVSLFWTAGAQVYPPIDPASGGATGHSLLASSLGIIFIFGLLPRFLQVPLRHAESRWPLAYSGLFISSVLAWALLEHGNASNTAVNQILGLAVLLIWVPIIICYYRAHLWPTQLHRWLRAFFCWWGFLTLSGFITFLPGVLDLMKFTNGMVAHAHLAMAGMLGAFNMLILGSLGRAEARDPWSDSWGYWLWQFGTALYVGSMLVQGLREGLDPTVLFGSNAGTTVCYVLRLLAGFILIFANLRWLYLLEAKRFSVKASTPPTQKFSEVCHNES